MGTSIKDARLVGQVTGNEKIPVSDGSGLPKAVTIEQIKKYIGNGGGGTIDLSDYATKAELKGKVDKVAGKQLSTEDFTTLLKQKLDGLSNYDDTEISQAIEQLRSDFDTLVSGDTTTAIKTFNEVIAFLEGISDTEDLASIIASIEQQIVAKQDKLVSGTNIKTINGESILGEGNIVIEGGVTEEYVNNAIASAITTTLNTEV